MADTEGFARWHFRVWGESLGMAMYPIIGPFWIINCTFFGCLNYMLPFRKRSGHDLPAWIAARTTEQFSVSLPDVGKLILYFIYVVLDAASTPGGLSISEEAMDAWKAKLESGEGVFTTSTYSIYTWDYLTKTLFTNPDLCNNVDGIYTTNDLFVDVTSILLTAAIAFILFKSAGKLAAGVGKAFGKQMTRRRNKKMKALAGANLEASTDTQTQVDKIHRQVSEILKMLQKADLKMIEDVDPDLQKIIHQTKKLRI